MGVAAATPSLNGVGQNCRLAPVSPPTNAALAAASASAVRSSSKAKPTSVDSLCAPCRGWLELRADQIQTRLAATRAAS